MDNITDDAVQNSQNSIGEMEDLVRRALRNPALKERVAERILRNAKISSKGADRKYDECAALKEELDGSIKKINSLRSTGLNDEEKKDAELQRADLRVIRNDADRKLTIATDVGKSLEAAADTYIYLYSIVTGETVELRKKPRFEEPHVTITEAQAYEEIRSYMRDDDVKDLISREETAKLYGEVPFADDEPFDIKDAFDRNVPVSDETSDTNETPVEEEVPVAEDTSSDEETPIKEEIPVTEETTATEDVSLSNVVISDMDEEEKQYSQYLKNSRNRKRVKRLSSLIVSLFVLVVAVFCIWNFVLPDSENKTMYKDKAGKVLNTVSSKSGAVANSTIGTIKDFIDQKILKKNSFDSASTSQQPAVKTDILIPVEEKKTDIIPVSEAVADTVSIPKTEEIPENSQVVQEKVLPPVSVDFTLITDNIVCCDITVGNLDMTFASADGKASVFYPENISTATVWKFMSALYNAFGSTMKGVSLETSVNGNATITFPAGITSEDIKYALEQSVTVLQNL